MKDPNYDGSYRYPYEEDLEDDYEDYDETVRADIGEDIRDILHWKEERDALAEKIKPIDFEDLPPIENVPEVGVVEELPPIENVPAENYMEGVPPYLYDPSDAYMAGQPSYQNDPSNAYMAGQAPYPNDPSNDFIEELPPYENIPSNNYMEGMPPVDPAPGNVFIGELSPTDSYRNAGLAREFPPPPDRVDAPLSPDGSGQEPQTAGAGYIPVEDFSPADRYSGGPGFAPERDPGYSPEGGGNQPPGSGRDYSNDHKKKKRRKTSRPYLFVSYAFVAIFFLLIGNLVYFNIKERDAILASPYNRRQDDLAANVRRGSILASDGTELAVTQTDELGNETRVYPYGSIFAHVIGYSANGRSGLEASENVNLLTTHMDLLERAERELKGKKAIGDNVVTTLSVRLQQTAWQALGDRRGAVVVLNPKTGAVLAMVSKPDFDPNTIGESWNAIVNDPYNSCLLNRSTQGLYVPGSTYKILTALAYYREHGTFDDYHYTCTGEITQGENTIHCAGGAVHGELDFAGAFAQSCNCAFSDMGRKLGPGPLIGVMDSLLLGKSLPSPVPASKSRYDLSKDDSVFRLMQTAFGQGGTTVTPWQMALIVSAIANGGTLMEPYLVDKVLSPEGKTISSHNPRSYRKLFKEDEADALSGLLRAVVTGGSGIELASFPVACYGKTGSGEFTRSDGSRGTHAWFVGYAGVMDADVAFAVIAEDSGSGADVAVPIAHAVLNAFYS